MRQPELSLNAAFARLGRVVLWVHASTTAAGMPGDLTLDRSVIAGGSGYSSAGAYSIEGTLGQADADPLQPASGGTYLLIGGFWSAPEQPSGLFSDGFE